MYSIYKKEIASYFNSLIGYLAIGLFLLLTGLVVWVFPDTSILDSGYATLEGFFDLAPYLFMFLIPAIAMRAIAGEKSDGTYDLLRSRPITLSQIVLGKFLGGFTITLLALLPTIFYAISVYLLAYPVGNFDTGATTGSFIGLILIASAFLSVSLFCSSLTKNAIVAFLLAIFGCFFTFYGIQAIAQIPFFYEIQNVLKNWGGQEHFEAIGRGVLTAKDLFYFLSFTTFFLILSIGHLGRYHRPRLKTWKTYGLVFVLILCINQPLVYNLFERLDFTADKRFTLSQTSKTMLQGIEKDIYITLFLDDEGVPNGFKNLRKAALDMARDIRSYANATVHINMINPLEGDEQQQQEYTQALINRGLAPTNLRVKTSTGFSQKLIFPAVIINDDEHEINVNLLQNKTGQSPEQILNNSIENLEYAFISAIAKLRKKEIPYIGFTEGHGESSDLELHDAMHTLGTTNQVGRLNLSAITLNDLQQIKVIIIAKPTKSFSESDKYKLDYYVRHGGNIIWAIDQIDASMENLRKNGRQPLIGRALNLDDQLFIYGARLNYNLVADLNCAQIPLSVGNIAGQSQIELTPWYFFPILMPTTNNPIVKNLDGIHTEFIGTIDTIARTGISKEILLHSSPFTRILKTPSEISLQMVEEQLDPNKFKTKPEPVAVLLQGKFPYLYENRPTPTGINTPVDLKNISKHAKMLVVADGDWLINQINSNDQSAFPLGWDRYTEQQYANKILLENIVDYLMNDEKLISLRSREVKLRLLDQAKINEEKLFWQVINVVFPIGILLIIGLIQQFLRKRKYTV